MQKQMKTEHAIRNCNYFGLWFLLHHKSTHYTTRYYNLYIEYGLCTINSALTQPPVIVNYIKLLQCDVYAKLFILSWPLIIPQRLLSLLSDYSCGHHYSATINAFVILLLGSTFFLKRFKYFTNLKLNFVLYEILTGL